MEKKIYNLGKKRMLCWDDFCIDKSDGLNIKMNKPVAKELAVVCDGDWEGKHNGYGSVVQVDGKYRFYYRAANGYFDADGNYISRGDGVLCLCGSDDGKTFKRIIVGKHPYDGKLYNNIFHYEERSIDNFAVFYDTNPNCPKDEKFKALSHMYAPDGKAARLAYYASADGIDFHYMRNIPVQGVFDSYNVMFWDEVSSQYYLYYRYVHDKDGNDIPVLTDENEPLAIRDIRVATSKDFVNFEVLGRLQYGENAPDFQMYTNQITKYYRADDMFIGLPARYTNRKNSEANYEQMPMYDMRKAIISKAPRGGTAQTDTLIMTSRDGYNFNRRNEAYMTPGIETPWNWWYGDCYTAYGLIETESDIEGAPNEISFFVGENYRVKNVNFRRYTVRLDGFFSWYGDYDGAEVLTKPFTFMGDSMEVNFATSSHGSLVVTLCDEDGKPIEDLTSTELFGDSVSRRVTFNQKLSKWNDQPVRLRFQLKDCDLFSYRFF